MRFKARRRVLSWLLTALMLLSSYLNIMPLTVAGAGTDINPPAWQDGTLNAIAVTDQSLTLNWSGAQDDTGVTGCIVYENSSVLTTVYGGNTYDVSGLQPATSYTFAVQALDAAGNESTAGPSITVTTKVASGSTNSNQVQETAANGATDQTAIVPAARAATDMVAGGVSSPYWQNGKLIISDLGYNTLTLSWSGAQDDVGVTGYNIYDNGVLLAGNTNYNPFYVNGLEPGTEHIFTVQALNYAGKESTDGPSVTVTTHSSGEIISATATVDTIYLYADHVTLVEVNNYNVLEINVLNATIKDGIGTGDVDVNNLPGSLWVKSVSKVDDHNLKITISGTITTSIVIPVSMTAVIKSSALVDYGLTASDPIPVAIKEITNISLNKPVVMLSKGDSEQLIANVTPLDAPDQTVTWSTSDSAVATVDSAGNVTAVGEGRATITAVVASGFSTSCGVIVAPVATPTTVIVDSLNTDHMGQKITVKFSKDMANPTGTQGQFAVKINGTVTSVTRVDPGLNLDEILLGLGSQVPRYDSTVTLSYTKDTVAAADGSMLDSFTDYPVTNNVLSTDSILLGMKSFTPTATEISYDATNRVIKFRFDDLKDYDNVTDLYWLLAFGFGGDGGPLFLSNLTSYVKFYEKDTDTAVPLPLVLWPGSGNTYGQTDNWYFTKPVSCGIGLNLTSCALKPSTTYVIEFLKGLTYNNGDCNHMSYSFEFTTTATSASKPVWPDNSSLTANPAGTNVALNWPVAQYHPSSAYPSAWPASDYHRGVTGYNIYQNGTLLTTVAESANSYQVTNLAPNTNYQFTVQAVDVAGNLSDALATSLTTVLLTPPVLTADAPNQTGSSVNLTFADDAAWRAAITGITVDGAPLNSIQYAVTVGNINIAPGVLNTDGDHTIVISAPNYNDASVVQSIITTPPVLNSHVSLPGGAADLTFTDNSAWRAAISGVSVDGTALNSSQYVVTAGHLYIVAGVLNTAGSYTISVSAQNYVDTSVTQTVSTALAPPVLTAREAFPESVVEMTFTDDATWRAAINGVSADGTALTSGQYVITAGSLKIAAGVLTAGSHTIAVNAHNYGDASVTQQIVTVKTPPVLTTDSTGNFLGSTLDLIFTDDAAWRAAISGVTVDGAVYLTGSQYTVTAGNLNIAAGILNTAGSHTITVSAAKYNDASVSQEIQLTTRFDALAEGAITTVAGIGGSGNKGYSGDNGPAASAKLYYPAGVAIDSASGAFYIADYNNNRIRKVDASGVITTVAGTGTGGYSGDGGPAAQANIYRPNNLVVDGSGNLYFSDYGNHRIRKMDSNGIITTIAGTGTSGYSGDGGPAADAQINSPKGLVLDASGNLYIGDAGNYRMRKVDLNSGVITTVAGNGTSGYSGEGGQATEAALKSLSGLDLDQDGNLYIADAGNYRVRKVDLNSGVITTVAGNGTSGISGDGGPATQANMNPNNVGLDSAGNLYITEGNNRVVRRVDAGGTITTIAGIAGASGFSGDGGPATEAKLYSPYSAVYDTNEGGLYVADYNNNCVRFIKLKQAVAMPIPSIPSGGVPSGTTVTLSTATDGAAICYTTDGSTPTSASTMYSGPITLTLSSGVTITIKAVALKAGLADSTVMTAEYALPYDAPTWAANTQITASNITAAGMTLTWTPAVDNVAVTGYQVYQDGTLLATVSSATIDVTGLAAGAGYEFKIKAGNALGGWSDFSPAQTIRTLPVLTADTIDNVLGKVMDITFTDDPAWRAAVTGVTVDGTALTQSQYSVSASAYDINIASGAFTTAGDHNIVIKATNYSDNAVLQTINTPLNPPVLNADSVNNKVGDGVMLTFTDDAAWRAAITGVKLNGVALAGGKYTFTPGILSIDASVMPALPGCCSIMVSATNYADTLVAQVIYGTGTLLQVLQALADGAIGAVAGQAGSSGYSGDGGPATSALLKNTYGVATDAAGNIYIADRNNYVVRKVDVNGNINTMAGKGTYGNSGDGGPALQAALYPYDVAVDSKGNLYILDTYFGVVRKVDPSGVISTVASSVSKQPGSIALDSSDNLYMPGNFKILKRDPQGVVTTVAGTGTNSYSGDGGPATQAMIGASIGGLAVDEAGNLYISDKNNRRIRKVDAASGIITTVAGAGTTGSSGDGGQATQALLSNPNGVTVDQEGNLYIADSGKIRRVDAGGIINTVASASAWDLYYDQNIGGLFFSDQGSYIVSFLKMTPLAATPAVTLPEGAVVNGAVVTLKAGASVTLSTTTEGAEIYYTTDGGTPTSASTLYAGPISVSKDMTLKAITIKAGLTDSPVLSRSYRIDNTLPPALTADSTDNVLGSALDLAFTDDPAWRVVISKVAVDGTALPKYQYTFSPGNLEIAAGAINLVGDHTLVVSALGYQDTSVSQAVYATRDIPDGYITIAAGTPGQYGYSGDGGLAVYALLNPKMIGVDQAGNLYIADYNNKRIRKVNTAGVITTVAGNGTDGCMGDNGPATEAAIGGMCYLAVDGAGNIYLPGYNRIRKVDTSGIITTIAGIGTGGYSGDGGSAAAATISEPTGIAIDQAGNLYFHDQGNARIRKIDTKGIITTVAGNGSSGYSGDGGPATQAQINQYAVGLCADPAGNLYIGDNQNCRIRKVDTSGIITTIAGTGNSGYSGDGGPAATAQINSVYGVTMDNAGNLYFGDAMNCRVRKIDTNGIITTIAGTGVRGYSGDAGPALEANTGNVYQVAYDSVTGGLYINSDSYYCIRFVKLAKSTGQQLTADTTDNTVGMPVEITLSGDQAWQTWISDITVDGASIAGNYTIGNGKITIASEVFSTAKGYTIIVKATGYQNTTVEQPIVNAIYIITPTADAAYQSGTTSEGFATMTVNAGMTGLKYFNVQAAKVKSHKGLESVVFIQLRNGVQINSNITKADFDTVDEAQAGFNVQPGDVIKAFIVDALTNDLNFNPIILE